MTSQNGYSVEYAEKDVVCIPAHSYKTFTEFSIATSVFRECGFVRDPSKKETAVREYPELVKSYFMKCVPVNDHKFVALHGAVWSGGSFIYVPKGVKLDKPLQSYFRINSKEEKKM